MLTPHQLSAYQRDGYLKLSGQVDEQSLVRFEQALARHRFDDGPTPGKTWPESGARYTLAKNCMADPDLAFIAEHSAIVPVARALLDDDPVLTAFVVYDRTTGGGGLPVHHDYKRWRPVGSSMNWCFSVVPLTDFDDETGQLFIAPGSHRLDRVRPGASRAQEVAAGFPSVSERCARWRVKIRSRRARLSGVGGEPRGGDVSPFPARDSSRRVTGKSFAV